MTMRVRATLFLLLASVAPVQVRAQQAPTAEDVARVERKIEELRRMRQDMQRQIGTLQSQMSEFDTQIDALQNELQPGQAAARGQTAAGQAAAAKPAPATQQAQTSGAKPSYPAETQRQAETEKFPQTIPGPGAPTAEEIARDEAAQERPRRGGFYEPGKGFVLVQDEEGELGAGVFSYVRYLNQNALPGTYKDHLGREIPLADKRQDIQMQKVSWNFKGWLFDPNFRYYFFFWTSNPQMGEGAQVVIGGYFQYRFSDKLIVTAGVMPLPTTRSTNYTFPNWLRNDNRVMADEFFRGSYSTGIDAQGEIVHGLRYRVALTNNLAQLGVSALELDNVLNTVSGALTWMPTTGEFGPSAGFGDFEEHKKLATLVGVHFTHSRETAQGQPSVNDFENSQIRLSDGTLLFSPDPFGTGGKLNAATYKMMALNAGLKYKGWYLEGEYYFRWVDNFELASGTVPVTSLYDNGFSIQASAMPISQILQPYVTYSKIFGQYGSPWELALGANIYPFRRKETRFNLQALKLNHSPVGGTSLPSQVGADGWVFTADWIVNF
jgi:hypothetical protein